MCGRSGRSHPRLGDGCYAITGAVCEGLETLRAVACRSCTDRLAIHGSSGRRHEAAVPRRGDHGHRLAVPADHRSRAGDRRLRPVPGLAGGGGAQPRAARLRPEDDRRHPAHPRPPRPLRLPAGRRARGLSAAPSSPPARRSSWPASSSSTAARCSTSRRRSREQRAAAGAAGRPGRERAAERRRAATAWRPGGLVDDEAAPARPAAGHRHRATSSRSTTSRTSEAAMRALPARRVRRAGRGRAGRPRDVPRCRPHPGLGHHRARRGGGGRPTAAPRLLRGPRPTGHAHHPRPDRRRSTAPTSCSWSRPTAAASTNRRRRPSGCWRSRPRGGRPTSGVLLIPAFAIGRTQEIVWELDRLLSAGDIPHVPALPRLADGLATPATSTAATPATTTRRRTACSRPARRRSTTRSPSSRTTPERLAGDRGRAAADDDRGLQRHAHGRARRAPPARAHRRPGRAAALRGLPGRGHARRAPPGRRPDGPASTARSGRCAARSAPSAASPPTPTSPSCSTGWATSRGRRAGHDASSSSTATRRRSTPSSRGSGPWVSSRIDRPGARRSTWTPCSAPGGASQPAVVRSVNTPVVRPVNGGTASSAWSPCRPARRACVLCSAGPFSPAVEATRLISPSGAHPIGRSRHAHASL